MSKDSKCVTDRSLLRFADEVKAHFVFLEARGFRCVRSEAAFVRFERPNLAVNIYHGRLSYEIGLEVESLAVGAEDYSLSEVLRLIDREKARHYRRFATHSAQGVSDGVRQLAEVFQQCVAAGLLEDCQLFSRLKQQREEMKTDFAQACRLHKARRTAEVAWRDKDYATVVRTLKPLRDVLSPSEVAKLKFAEKHLGNNGDAHLFPH